VPESDRAGGGSEGWTVLKGRARAGTLTPQTTLNPLDREQAGVPESFGAARLRLSEEKQAAEVISPSSSSSLSLQVLEGPWTLS